MKLSFSIAIQLFILLSVDCFSQGYLKSDYLFSSSLKNEEGETFGSGGLLKLSGRYTLPLSVKQNNKGQVSAWSATLSASYGIFTKEGIPQELSFDKIVNLNLSIAHIRPLSEKWYLIASLGGGIYSAPDAITSKSLLANGGAIFVYKLRKGLDLGVGLGLTNSYGIPLIMPMSYIKWQLTGKYEIKADIASGMEISASMQFSDQFKLKLVAMEMDGMSSVFERKGKSMIYATTMMKSYLTPEFKLNQSTTLFAGIGGVWMRSVRLSRRTFKGFLDNFKDNELDMEFAPATYLTIGFRAGF
ncbi:hypothetical protein M2459_000448 [Parabacteroides sp. PF5-5]|uniref:DUF6268 family outer membrane beta-barrel protein n=1 Tax=unclassified Parabacteroides TaxID=2649774 RepID=UPI0024740FD3|nr:MULTISPECIES: DUF6268 family outer membrane beta-barrel protein [unclassified Parabacteroides]MDH6303618.1 hypothetical protein [Parabacteroides sp. PH5-39]MDH6314940.1 hypothetical protein [Parabacteroides sp. PF5-13]MDH6318277.1 hypothetical protein [Parabacteroides sp. PH5-13]MDH6321790.1 hypothetical protein [Parabacteroides sp. PH5-8]MDH6325914.1 hypothetical protein [Parabacteroides sp. PH5-41]